MRRSAMLSLAVAVVLGAAALVAAPALARAGQPAATPGQVTLTAAPRTPAPSEVADAVMHQDVARLHALLAAHADVNSAQPDGSTALHWAAYRGDAATAAALLAAGAHPNVRTG
ncbi:MAG: ankyrin repeat domain-containing protein, partial [Steroidobacteraceae bacterium]